MNPLSAIFDKDNFQSYSQKSSDKVIFKEDPVNSQKIKEALTRKKDFRYAFGSGKHLEALKNLKIDEDPDVCELIDEELIFSEKGKKEIISGKYELETDSLLIYDSIGKGFEGDPYAYKPELGSLNTFDFPDVLPNLSGWFFEGFEEKLNFVQVLSRQRVSTTGLSLRSLPLHNRVMLSLELKDR